MIAPTGNLRTDDQIVRYFDQVANAIGPDTPLVFQDYPLVTGVQMTAEVIGRMMQNNSGWVMVKHEDWPGLDKITELRQSLSAGASSITPNESVALSGEAF